VYIVGLTLQSISHRWKCPKIIKTCCAILRKEGIQPDEELEPIRMAKMETEKRTGCFILRVRLNALHFFTSCTPIWSGKVCNPS
jgi:hypothetical protein